MAVGLGVAVGETTSTTSIQPTIRSSVSGGRIVSTGGGINVRSIYNSDQDGKVVNGTGAAATAHAAAGSLIATSGATATATETPNLDTFVESDATLSAQDTITITANSTVNARGAAGGQSGGLVGVGRSNVRPPPAAAPPRRAWTAPSPARRNLDVKALAADRAAASSQAVGGGLWGQTDNSASATARSNLDAHIGGAIVTVSGNITVEANASPEADATTRGVS